MKIKISQAVAFLVALGFAKAGSWDVPKLTARLEQVPEKVAKDDVPEEFVDLYAELAAAKDPVEIVVEGGGAAPAKDSKAKDKKKGRGAKPPPATPASKSTVGRDYMGCRLGTFAAKVNAVLSKDWMTEQEISEAAGVPMVQTRDRLYYARTKGLVEQVREIKYRLVPAKK